MYEPVVWPCGKTGHCSLFPWEMLC